MPTLLEVRTKIRAEAIIGRGTLAGGNSRRRTTTRVRSEETRERQSARDKAQSSPRATYAFIALDTTNLPAEQRDAARFPEVVEALEEVLTLLKANEPRLASMDR
jgi:hypothetical protein